MVNLGICRRCPKCSEFNAALVNDKGERVRNSIVECEVLGTQEVLGWDSSIPDECPYLLEQRVMSDSMESLSENLKEEDEDDETQL